MKDYYAVLGIPRDAKAGAVKNAYERKMKKAGRLSDARRADEEKALKEAFAVLSNPSKRADLDAHLVEIDANLGGGSSNTPLVVGIVVVLLTIAGVGYFLTERWKEQKAVERQKAAQPAKARGQQ